MGCTVHGILQARILEWVAVPLCGRSSGSRNPWSPALQADSLPTELSGCGEGEYSKTADSRYPVPPSVGRKKRKNLGNSCEVYSREEWIPKRLRPNPRAKESFPFPDSSPLHSVEFSSVVQSCLTLCDPMNRSMPGLLIHHQIPEFTQTHVHRVGDAIQPSHPLSFLSPPAPYPSQHQSLLK